MKEITRIITVQITDIAKVNSEKDVHSKEEEAKAVAEMIKEELGVDDVVITNVQDFIRDVEEGE